MSLQRTVATAAATAVAGAAIALFSAGAAQADDWKGYYGHDNHRQAGDWDHDYKDGKGKDGKDKDWWHGDHDDDHGHDGYYKDGKDKDWDWGHDKKVKGDRDHDDDHGHGHDGYYKDGKDKDWDWGQRTA